jgi:hypothetical protein
MRNDGSPSTASTKNRPRSIGIALAGAVWSYDFCATGNHDIAKEAKPTPCIRLAGFHFSSAFLMISKVYTTLSFRTHAICRVSNDRFPKSPAPAILSRLQAPMPLNRPTIGKRNFRNSDAPPL